MRRYKYGLATALAVFMALALAMPVMAAYYSTISVTESNGTSYDMLPVLASMDIDYLADNHFIEADGRDVRVKTGGGADVPFMLVDDKVLFASEIDESITNQFRFSTGNSLISDYAIVVGDGGYITTADHANLEPADDFEIEFDSYIDTDDTLNLLTKTDAFGITTDGVGHLIATIYSPDDIQQTSQDDYIELYTGQKIRGGERIDSFPSSVISQVSFYMSKVGSPTGTLYCRIRRVSDDGIVGTLGSIDVSTLPTHPVATWYDFTDDVTNPTAQNLRFTVEYDGGDASNKVRVRIDTANPYADGELTYYVASWTDDSGDDAAFKVLFGDDITATANVVSGEHTIKVTGDGSDLKIYEDDILEDTATIVAIQDNANDWTIADMPYCNYFKLTAADTLRLTYDPDDIITGTTLVNETAAGTYDGTITYGTNPAGIAVAMSGLETTAVSYPTDPVESTDIIQPTTADLFDVNLERLQANPLQPIVAIIASGINLTERLVWLALAFIGLFILLVFILDKSEGQLSFTFFGGAAYCLIMYLLGIYPLWIIVVFTIAGIASLVYERVIAL